MYDQSFNKITLHRTLRKSDFRDYPALKAEPAKRALIRKAVKSAFASFAGKTPLSAIPVNGKVVYVCPSLIDELVLRKLCLNIKHVTKVTLASRDLIISNLTHQLCEGVPYRLYRLDIKSFYESFSVSAIEELVESMAALSPHSKDVIRTLMKQYQVLGGTGVPRGLAISALLSELMMKSFDHSVRTMSGVYFYSRYVDDIVIITSAEEQRGEFLARLKLLLPAGLGFHGTKRGIYPIRNKVAPHADVTTTPSELLRFSYLGYEFCVYEPRLNKKIDWNEHFRRVSIDLSPAKLKRIKTRIARSFLAFGKDPNFQLLLLRMKFLATNFSVKDLNRNNFKLAGIYHSYPAITHDFENRLAELDRFLRYATLTKTGRAFKHSTIALSSLQRRQLLKQNFVSGHKNKSFVYFSPSTISEVQECWVHEQS